MDVLRSVNLSVDMSMQCVHTFLHMNASTPLIAFLLLAVSHLLLCFLVGELIKRPQSLSTAQSGRTLLRRLLSIANGCECEPPLQQPQLSVLPSPELAPPAAPASPAPEPISAPPVPAPTRPASPRVVVEHPTRRAGAKCPPSLLSDSVPAVAGTLARQCTKPRRGVVGWLLRAILRPSRSTDCSDDRTASKAVSGPVETCPQPNQSDNSAQNQNHTNL